MKKTCTDRVARSISEAIIQDRYFLPEVKEKLRSVLTPSEIYQLGLIAAKALQDDSRIKVSLSHKEPEKVVVFDEAHQVTS